MSKYSGKCDVYDMLGDLTDQQISEYKIYAYGNEIIPLKINTPSDLIPYYPYIVRLWFGDTIHLSEKSFVDSEEEEFLTFYMDELKRYWRRCKRNKTPFDSTRAYEMITMSGFVQPWNRELVDRVAESGEKATFEGVHIPAHDAMREKLYKEMLANGYDDDRAYRWCFGINRWVKWFNEKNTVEGMCPEVYPNKEDE